MRESFIFYRSFFEAIKDLDDKKRLKMYDLIANFALNEYEIEEKNGICKQLFTLIKPQISANNKRFESGKKGGRPAKEKTNGFFEKKPNNNVNENVNVNVNVNENVNEKKEIEKAKNSVNFYGEYGNVFLTPKSYDVLFALTMDEILLKTLINELSEAIARKSDRYKPYDEKFPDAHFCYLKAFWKQRKEHPEKFLPKNSADTGGNVSKNSEINAVVAFLKKQKDKNK